ncbi:MAG: hypothetical protein ACJAYU_003511 [Bradymonadia bacterium]
MLVASIATFTACAASIDDGENGENPSDNDLTMIDDGPTGDVDRVADEGKEDGLGALGPAVDCCADTAVWEVRNQWTQSSTTEARLAGLAWTADSGLDWEEKYRLWVASLGTTDGEWTQTFEVTNPWGKTLPAPVLECAEVAYFLRASFSAWYGLPFYAEARDAQGPLYLGHFGFVRRDGSRHDRSPRFARYSDWSGDHAHGSVPSAWPSDSTLRGRGLYGGGDEVPFLDDLRAGAYFDEMFLNKRVGYFLLVLLTNFGSVHLADTKITFHVKAEALQAGDVLIERWQRRGIGHTVPVMRVNEVVEGRFEAWVSSGSMPRRQPVWEEPAAARRYFTNNLFGGVGQSSDGEAYSALGGGLRRWRVAVEHQGRWRNTVSESSRDVWINSGDHDSLAARTARFGELLDEVGPEEQRDVLISVIEAKREHLSRYPASCSARIAREEAFEQLYELMETEFSMNRTQVDENYRTLADYVFAELKYEDSRTCCWNSSTSDMYDIAMDYNRGLQEDACAEPAVFMMRDGAYDVFKTHADSLGRGAEWITWSADESCPQASTVTTDSEAEHAWTTFCDLGAIVDPEPEPGNAECSDGNDTFVTAEAIGADGTRGRICSGDDDYFQFTTTNAGEVTVSVSFRNADGDLELALLDSNQTSLRSSTTTSDVETVTMTLQPGSYVARVYGYSGADNLYELTLQLPAGTVEEPVSGDGNDSVATAVIIQAGVDTPGAIDEPGDIDYYRVPDDFSGVTASFTHANGDLDIALVREDGTVVDTSQGTEDWESLTTSGPGVYYLKVYGYGDATGAYSVVTAN